MGEPSVVYNGDGVLDLPPGFRFHPTNEEIVTHYLTEKVLNSSFSATAIGEADLNKCEPWDLPEKAKMGEKDQWYFFCQKDRKYPTGTRTNRATASGYWKTTGKDIEIFKGKGGCLVGMKKTLVFYKGRAPKGEKTNWVMHEFRLEGKDACHHLPRAAKDEWTVCKVFHKNTAIQKTLLPKLLRTDDVFADDFLDWSSPLPPLMDPAYSGDTEFNGTTSTVSSTKVSGPGYYDVDVLSPINQLIMKQETSWKFPMSTQSTFTNSSFPYQNINDDPYHQGFTQSVMNNYGTADTSGAGFWESDDAILKAFLQ